MGGLKLIGNVDSLLNGGTSKAYVHLDGEAGVWMDVVITMSDNMFELYLSELPPSAEPTTGQIRTNFRSVDFDTRRKAVTVSMSPINRVPIDRTVRLAAQRLHSELGTAECCRILNVASSTWYNLIKEGKASKTLCRQMSNRIIEMAKGFDCADQSSE